MAERTAIPRPFLHVAALAVIIGGLLRVYAAMGEFWLDEIWSWGMSRQAASLLGVLNFRVDNNHALNTMLMRVIGDQDYWPLYRVPSIVAGAASIVLAGLIARRWSLAAALIAMLLLAVAFPFVLYGSEARGYSLAVMFMLLAILLAIRLNDDESTAASRIGLTTAFAAACGLGMLAHPLFLQPYLALLAWSIVRGLTDRTPSARTRVIRLASMHIAPALFAVVLYLAHWRGMQVAGGEIHPAWRAIVGAFALLAGVHGGNPAATVGAGIAVALAVAAAMWRLFARREPFAVFALLAIAVIPLLMLAILRPTVLYERYFLLPLTCGAIVLAGMLGDMVGDLASSAHSRVRARGIAMRAAALAIVAILAVSNISRDVRLILSGRGGYLQALELIAADTARPEIVISSDHDFRNQMTLAFYMRFIDKPVRYIPAAQWNQTGGEGGEWFIVHDFGHRREPAADVTDRAGVRWRKVADFDADSASGFRWFVYHRRSP